MKREYSYGVVPLKLVEKAVFILLIFHKGGKHWGFPKGHKDHQETDLETAKKRAEGRDGARDRDSSFRGPLCRVLCFL